MGVGKKAKVTTGERVKAKYLFLVLAANRRKKRQKVCRPRDSAWQKNEERLGKKCRGARQGCERGTCCKFNRATGPTGRHFFQVAKPITNSKKKMKPGADEQLQGVRMGE